MTDHELRRAQTVGQSGEAQVLRRVLAQLSAADRVTLGPGDDCAVLTPSGNTVVTSDTMVEGFDFRLDWHEPFDLGWKLAATNLSDVAAMGAVPAALTVSIVCPRSTPVVQLEEVAAGLDRACQTLAPGSGVVGGDLATGPQLMFAVTALGNLEGIRPVTRSGARAGDTIAYAGELGLSGLGLSLLLEGAASVAELWAAHPGALAAHLAPTPPIPLGRSAAQAGARAMLDVSDGLLLDAERLARASGVQFALENTLLRQGFGEQQGEHVALEHMLTGGEDHGLLATFPSEAPLPDGFVAIGVCRGQADGALVVFDGTPVDARGWDTFASTPAAS